MAKANKKSYTNRLDRNSMTKLKVYCMKKNYYQNEIIEKVIQELLDGKRKAYESKSNDRKNYTYTLDEKILKKFRIYCAEKNYYQNDIVEGLIINFLKEEEGVDNGISDK